MSHPSPDPFDPRTLPPPAWPPQPQTPPAYPPSLPVPAWARPKLPVLPTEPVEYQQLLRSPRHRWWKPLATLGLFAIFAQVAIVVLTIPLYVAGAVADDPQRYIAPLISVAGGGEIRPLAFLFVNLSLIVLIPSAMLARWIVYRQRPRFLTSVTGGLRWRWLGRCLLITVPIWGIYVGGTTLLGGDPGARPAYWWLLLIMVLLTTPLQCAGEEYTFRGLIMQTVGAWFRKPIVSLVVSAIPAAGLFAAAHGSPDPYILAQLSIFALSCVIVTWRTGGLEAGIAMHASNNVILMVISLTAGGWGNQFVSGDTKGDLTGLLLEIGIDALAVALIWWQAKRAGLRRFSFGASDPSGREQLQAPVGVAVRHAS